MGYQRSRHTSTVATVEITPSCHVNSRNSSKIARAIHDKENAAAAAVSMNGSQRRYPSRATGLNAVMDQRTLEEENGGSQSASGKSKTLTRGKRVKFPGKDMAKRKRTCLQIRDDNAAENSIAEGLSVCAADRETKLEAKEHLCVEEEQFFQHNSVLGSRDEEVAHDGRSPDVSNEQTSSTEGPVEDQSATSVILKVQELYSKLHLKYKQLKERKFSEVEEHIEGINRNLIAYVQAQQELLEHIGSKNDWLELNADQEKITIIFNRLRLLEQEKIEWQNNLLVQNTKNLELINEVKRLKSLLSDHVEVNEKIQNISRLCQHCKVDCSIIGEKLSLSQDIHFENQCGNLIPYHVGLESNSVLHNYTVQTERFQYSCQACGHNNSVEFGKQERKLVGNETSLALDSNVQVGLDKIISNGDNQLGKDAQKGEAIDMVVGRVNGFVKVLFQGMVGFKITIADGGNSPKLVFLHQSSGFSFHLIWPHYENNLNEDGELIYQVVSLGTLHRIAPDWMKEEIIFNIAQVDVFFNRLLQVANGRAIYLAMR